MKDGRMTDEELVRSCLEGQRESYRTLMDRYGENAMAIALNILMNYQDAEDACQEAFMKAYKNLKKFDPQRNFKNWFYALLSNLCLDQIRKRKYFSNFLRRFKNEEQAAGITQPAPSAGTRLLDFKFLRRLSPKERSALYLWSQEGYSGAEIATALGCSPNTAHVYLFRARTKLKAMLGEKKNGPL